MATMKGIDVSGWNKEGVISEQKPEFVIVKATEGVGYVSDGLHRLYREWRDYASLNGIMPLTGFYHYARPDLGNSGRAEAHSFLDTVGGLAGLSAAHPLYALDWEGAALGHSQDWALDFLNVVKKETGSTPFIYMSSSVTRQYDWSKVCQIARLWAAAYASTLTKSDIKYWERYSMWQYTSTPVDTNKFMADSKAWINLANGEKGVSTPVKNWVITEQTENKIVMELK